MCHFEGRLSPIPFSLLFIKATKLRHFQPWETTSPCASRSATRLRRTARLMMTCPMTMRKGKLLCVTFCFFFCCVDLSLEPLYHVHLLLFSSTHSFRATLFYIDPNREPVYLNVYDLMIMNYTINRVGLGVYHTGVEIYGRGTLLSSLCRVLALAFNFEF